MRKLKNYVNGEWISYSAKTLAVINPYNEKKIAFIVNSDENDVNNAVKSARRTFEEWRNTSPGERAQLFLALADEIEKEKQRIAEIETEQQGKTIALALADIEFGIDNIRFFAGACRTMQATMSGEYLNTYKNSKHKLSGTSILRREPLGVVAAIIPWNYPFSITCWKLASVAAGNTIIIKPSSYTPLTAFELAIKAEKVGFPKGVINVITGAGEKTGALLAKHQGIDCIALTGSTETGKQIMQFASQSMKKVILELGGKAPFIVFADADLEKAVQTALDASIVNTGQDCTAAARIYVQKIVYEKFISLIKERAKSIVLGDPSKHSTNLGPLISAHQRSRLSSLMKQLQKNEKIIYESDIPKKGFFFPLTIIRDMQNKSAICQNELFGPIIALSSFEEEKDIIQRTNDSIYGLAGSIWTSDVKRAFRIARELNLGEVWINDHLPLASEMPHGGTKQSGHGRNLSIHALEEYTYLKHVYVGLN